MPCLPTRVDFLVVLGGAIMARATRHRNEWIISLLDIQHTDRILEIGFGLGAMIQLLAGSAPEGFVAGMDLSTYGASGIQAQ